MCWKKSLYDKDYDLESKYIKFKQSYYYITDMHNIIMF